MAAVVAFGNAHGKDLVLDFTLRPELWKELWPECQREHQIQFSTHL